MQVTEVVCEKVNGGLSYERVLHEFYEVDKVDQGFSFLRIFGERYVIDIYRRDMR